MNIFADVPREVLLVTHHETLRVTRYVQAPRFGAAQWVLPFIYSSSYLSASSFDKGMTGDEMGPGAAKHYNLCASIKLRFPLGKNESTNGCKYKRLEPLISWGT